MSSSIQELGAYSAACRDSSELLEIEPDMAQFILERYQRNLRNFVVLGKVALGGNDTLIDAGLKLRSPDSVQRVAEELYLGDKLLEHNPRQVNALPLFTLPVLDRNDGDFGILTEDFTEGGTQVLGEHRRRFPLFVKRDGVPEGLYRDVYDALDGRVHSEAFGHMAGDVDGREVLVDFNDVAYPDESSLERYRQFARSIAIRL